VDGNEPPPARFPRGLMYRAAALYYEQDVTQAEVAHRLRLSRATVSRLLAEARRAGIVRIEVTAPVDHELDGLAGRVAAALGLAAAWIAPSSVPGAKGEGLTSALSAALRAAPLAHGDIVLVSSGRTVYQVTQGALPRLPRPLVAPMIGGQDEPEVWYASNEIVRQLALRVGGDPVFLYAPALPGPELYRTLMDDPTTRRVIDLWSHARCAIVAVGAPPLTRTSLPRFIASDAASLHGSVGDVCSRFYDAHGDAVAFPGSERLIATRLERLREIPTTIAVAAGARKVPAILTGARSGYFNQLVSDAETAGRLVEAASSM
jgi:DNA-binding transcriptional regulator LsrR (DeoR family)